MKTGGNENAKITEIIAFTIIESIFVIIAVTVLALILAGLYFKHNKLPAPNAPESVGELSRGDLGS